MHSKRSRRYVPKANEIIKRGKKTYSDRYYEAFYAYLISHGYDPMAPSSMFDVSAVDIPRFQPPHHGRKAADPCPKSDIKGNRLVTDYFKTVSVKISLSVSVWVSDCDVL